MTTIETGNRAEQAAHEFLVREGYVIIERNFRRRYCEIDIVAQRADVIHFVEVKYRATDHFGGGLEYITLQKQQHMARAAETWVIGHRWDGEYTLSAIEVGGPKYDILEFIESIWGR